MHCYCVRDTRLLLVVNWQLHVLAVVNHERICSECKTPPSASFTAAATFSWYIALCALAILNCSADSSSNCSRSLATEFAAESGWSSALATLLTPSPTSTFVRFLHPPKCQVLVSTLTVFSHHQNHKKNKKHLKTMISV
jgi:hypothetical protein